MKKWTISKSQKKLLDKLFKFIETKKIKKVLDAGAGRTSVHYLASRFKKVNIEALVYPGDYRKTEPILECVPEKNYEIIESDIKNFRNKKYDLVLAHLFLGEAEKFGGNKFASVLKSLFYIKTKYLVVVNRDDDKINYDLLVKCAKRAGKITEFAIQLTESGHYCFGFTIKFKK